MRAEHEINYVFSMFLPVESTLVAQCIVHNTKPLFCYYTAVTGYMKLMILFLVKPPDPTLTYLMFSISLCRSEKGPLWASWTTKLTAAHTSSASCFRLNCMEKKKKKEKKHWLNTFPAAQLWTLYSRAAWLFPLKLTVLIRWTWDRLGSENGVVKLSEDIFQRT